MVALGNRRATRHRDCELRWPVATGFTALWCFHACHRDQWRGSHARRTDRSAQTRRPGADS